MNKHQSLSKSESKVMHLFIGLKSWGFDGHPLDHWTKAQSELASVFDKNGKGVANEPLAVEGVGGPLQHSLNENKCPALFD